MDLNNEISKILKQCNQIEIDLNDLFDERKDIQKNISSLKDRLYIIDQKNMKNISSLKVYESIEKNNELYFKPVQNLLNISEVNKEIKKRIVGSFADLIDIDEKYLKTIETNFFSLLQNIVTYTDEDAKYLVEFLKSNKIGRVTFLPINRFNYKDYNAEKYNNAVKASDIIKSDKNLRGIINYYFSKILITDTSESALRLSKNKSFSKVLTLDGDAFSTNGQIVGGYQAKSNNSILSNKKTIDKLNNEISRDSSILRNINEELSFLKKNSLKLDDKEKELLSFSKIKLSEKLELDNKINISKFKLNEINKEISYLNKSIENLDKTVNDNGDFNIIEEENRLKLLKDEINSKSTKAEDLRTNLGYLETNILKLNSELDISNRNILLFNNNKIETEDKLDNSKKQLDINTTEIANLKVNIEKLDTDINENNKKIKSLEFKSKSFEDTIFSIKENIRQKKILKNEVMEKRFDLNNDINLLEIDSNKISAKLDEFLIKIVNVKNKLLEDYNLTEEALEIELEKIDKIDTNQNKIKTIRKDLLNIGSYSIECIDEFKKVESDLNEYKSQYNDLINSKKDIENIIKNLTHQCELVLIIHLMKLIEILIKYLKFYLMVERLE